jgi:hypothetical protein
VGKGQQNFWSLQMFVPAGVVAICVLFPKHCSFELAVGSVSTEVLKAIAAAGPLKPKPRQQTLFHLPLPAIL